MAPRTGMRVHRLGEHEIGHVQQEVRMRDSPRGLKLSGHDVKPDLPSQAIGVLQLGAIFNTGIDSRLVNRNHA